jgi:hypothetical protein
MKRFILMMTMAAFLSGASLALASSSSARVAIDQAWKSVEVWRKAQDQRFKAIESEHGKMFETTGVKKLVPRGNRSSSGR